MVGGITAAVPSLPTNPRHATIYIKKFEHAYAHIPILLIALLTHPLQAPGTCYRKNVNLAVKIVHFDARPYAVASTKNLLRSYATELNNTLFQCFHTLFPHAFFHAPFSTRRFLPRLASPQPRVQIEVGANRRRSEVRILLRAVFLSFCKAFRIGFCLQKWR